MEDMRESANRVRFFAGDMTPVEGREGVWRLPKSHRALLQPVKDLLLLYNRNYRGAILEQAKASGLGVSFDYDGLDCLWVEHALIPDESEMGVIIVLPKPLEAQASAALRKTGVPRGMEALIDDFATPKEQSQTEELDGNQIDGAITIENLRKTPTILLSRPKTSTDSEARTPEREFRSMTLQVGDVLQLFEHDGIHVADGGIAIMLLRYKTEKTT
ncbi:hypothetical protein RB595_006689 [Gaeumannomyces hyphopodioides]